jgi:hypothetical protein
MPGGCSSVSTGKARDESGVSIGAAVQFRFSRASAHDSEGGRAASTREGRRVRTGDYMASERDLYRVEHVRGQRVLLEDCRSGDLVDIDARELSALELVRTLSSSPVPT